MPARFTFMLAALITTAAVFAAGISSAAHASGHLLTGTVGPSFNITIKDASGRLVKVLPHGTYMLTVRDRSNIHDFHLIGPGTNNIVTSVPFIGTKTISVTLRPGSYRYQCDPHSFVMNGSFRVR